MRSNTKIVAQYKGNKRVATYRSILLASATTGAQPAHIGKVTNGLRNTAGGYYWKSLKSFNANAKGVKQMDKSGNVLAIYADLDTAATLTGIKASSIENVMNGTKRSAGGFVFA